MIDPAADLAAVASRVAAAQTNRNGGQRWLAALRLWLISRRGRWRAGIAFLLGVLATLALPPFHGIPLLVPAFVGLVWLIDERAASRRTAFAIGWCFGFGFFLAGLYWISIAFDVRGPALAWAGPFAVVGLAALLAGFIALATLAARLAARRGVAGALVLALAWSGAEWLRGVVLTGFPWNLIGSVWTFSEAMIQVTAVIGTTGLGLLTVAAAAMPASLADRAARGRREAGACLAAGAMLVVIWAGGAVRLELAGPTAYEADVRLRLVQPSIAQAIKWHADLRDPILDIHIDLSQSGAVRPGPDPSGRRVDPAPAGRWDAATPPTLVIWAETAVTLFLDEDPERLARVATAVPADGHLIVGTLRREPVDGPVPYEIRNSLLAVTARAEVVATYDKVHLVPFGEYMPLRAILGFDKLTDGGTDLSPGPGLTTIDLPGVPPFSPLICYEVIFPGAVVAPGTRPRWLLNLTNDAWYRVSTGPYQHFAAARLRAVEEGLPLVRVANTGISAVVDSYGRVVAALGLEDVGVVDALLPKALDAPTPYHRYGDLALVVLGLAVAAAVLLTDRRSRSPALPDG